MTKSRTFALYLAKSDIVDFTDIFSPPAREKIVAGRVIISSSTYLGRRATIYVFDSPPRPPSWLSDVTEVFPELPKVSVQSSAAVVVFEQSDRIFVTPFANGWQYIDDTSIESEFGLRVSINSLNEKKVRRIDSNHLGEAMKGVSQSAFQRDLQAFGIDEALDLVRRITGQAENDDFAKSLSGATSLKISKEMTLSDLSGLAVEALDRFVAEDYKNTSFQIIDKVRPVSDKVVLATLDVQAVEEIKASRDTFELAMPGWSEEDVVYYGFFGLRQRNRFPDLLMQNYLHELGAQLATLSLDMILNKHGIYAEFANDAMVKKSWSIKKALIGSLTFNGGLHAACEGEWYRLDQQFKEDVDASFRSIVEDWGGAPEVLKKKITPDGKKTGFETELEYNKRCAEAYHQVCLDQEILSVPSIQYGKFEACDLIDIEGKRLIHVKKSSRQSSVLSHFFKQGSNSGRILKTFPESRDALVNKVRNLTDDITAAELEASLGGSMNDWKVEFHIIDAPRRDGTFAIPFFSRITLREETRALRGMGFSVGLKFIQVRP